MRGVVRVLAVADEESTLAYSRSFQELAPDLVVGCGDLPFAYLEYLVTTISKPLVFVPGNHDPESRSREAGIFWPGLPGPVGPEGCINIDRKVVEIGGLRIGGLGGSLRYKSGPNQYTQKEMRLRSRRLALRARFRRPPRRRPLDLLVTHTPPLNLGDLDDPCHEGFDAYLDLIRATTPLLHAHGHVHPYGGRWPDRELGTTRIVNVVPYRILELEP
jgi:uncharacterized protein